MPPDSLARATNHPHCLLAHRHAPALPCCYLPRPTLLSRQHARLPKVNAHLHEGDGVHSGDEAHLKSGHCPPGVPRLHAPCLLLPPAPRLALSCPVLPCPAPSLPSHLHSASPPNFAPHQGPPKRTNTIQTRAPDAAGPPSPAAVNLPLVAKQQQPKDRRDFSPQQDVIFHAFLEMSHPGSSFICSVMMAQGA